MMKYFNAREAGQAVKESCRPEFVEESLQYITEIIRKAANKGCLQAGFTWGAEYMKVRGEHLRRAEVAIVMKALKDLGYRLDEYPDSDTFTAYWEAELGYEDIPF